MKNLLFAAFCGSLLFFVFSCRKDFDYDPATKALKFSKDTLMLDTVFTQTRSETYAVKVYNQQNKDVVIPKIYLENLNNSYYKINVDGTAGYSFENVPLRAHDSLYVFVEIAPAITPVTDALVEENLIFNTVGQNQTVKLMSLVEDADFYFPSSGSVKEISTDMTWNNNKSKVIFGELKFTNGAKLTINPGTRVYFHKNSSLTIDEGGELNINGTLNNNVIIRGDRSDPRYDSLPANWNQILLKQNSISNINYALLKGGGSAFVMEPDASMNIKNSQFYNFVSSGIHSIGGTITGQNLAFNNCGDADLNIEYGGNYDFTHCTFANYWDMTPSNRLAVYMSNYYNNAGTEIYNDLTSNFYNCIFWSKGNSSMYFDEKNNAAFSYNFYNSLIKYSTSWGVNPTNDTHFISCLYNEDPLFTNINYSKNLLYVKSGSPALSAGNPTYSAWIPTDIKGVNRTSNPTLGAYQ